MKVDVYEIIERYYERGSVLYSILVRHSEAVRDKALQIADMHSELNIDKEFVAEAAMLHDIGIFMTDAAGIECCGTHRYIEHGYLGAELLRGCGLEKHARVCERHTGSGLPLVYIVENDLPLPHKDLIPETIEEKLICYADKFFSKTRLDSEDHIERVRRKMAKWGEDSLARFNEMDRLFG